MSKIPVSMGRSWPHAMYKDGKYYRISWGQEYRLEVRPDYFSVPARKYLREHNGKLVSMKKIIPLIR